MKKNFLQKKQKGAAMLISVLFFLFISIAIVAGLVAPSAREFKISNDSMRSRQSFFLSESGVEDAYYRIKTSRPIGTSETITLNGSSVTTSIVDNGGGSKTIASTGDVSLRQRKNEVKISAGTVVSFNYGVQTGQGGVSLASGQVNGNLYANGPITANSAGDNWITGTAISANSPALAADQVNGSGVPSYNVTFANNNTTQDVAQSFVLSTSSPVNKVQLYIKKVGTPGNSTVTIRNDSSGAPGSIIFATGTLINSSVTTSYGWVDVSFTTNPLLVVGTTYWVMLDSSTNASNYYIIGANNNGYVNGIGKIATSGGIWSNTTPSGLDYYFNIYLGGVTGLIQGAGQWTQIPIGTVSGSAQAHTVNNANVTGLIYCQTGTGNNKSCTSQTDPVYEDFPVSQGFIDQWKEEAEAGGVTNGNVTVGSAGATIGPRKIVGNLTINGGGTLTVTGNIWVTGTITNTSIIRLDTSYGSNGGVIISDSAIGVTNGGKVYGSGISGSYTMLLSTSASTLSNAINISGNAGAPILYAPYGIVNITGGSAQIQEAVGYKLLISGNSSITYQSGLANMPFTNGPSGVGWSTTSWQEVE